MKRKYEGSKADLAEDNAGATQLGMSPDDYEGTDQDAAEDAAGQAAMAAPPPSPRRRRKRAKITPGRPHGM